MNLSFEAITFLFNLPFSNGHFRYGLIRNSEVIIIYLFKSFYDSGKFKTIFNNLTSLNQNIYVLKLEDFDIDQKIFRENHNYFRGIYDLYKHKADSFDGYEFRRLLEMLDKENYYKIIKYVNFYIYRNCCQKPLYFNSFF